MKKVFATTFTEFINIQVKEKSIFEVQFVKKTLVIKCFLFNLFEPTANTLCRCWLEEDTTNHWLKCHLLEEPCSGIDLADIMIEQSCVSTNGENINMTEDSN